MNNKTLTPAQCNEMLLKVVAIRLPGTADPCYPSLGPPFDPYHDRNDFAKVLLKLSEREDWEEVEFKIHVKYRHITMNQHKVGYLDEHYKFHTSLVVATCEVLREMEDV